ncbi:hypothetical protein GN958_ATG03797 [Phytophthora infestans]|uniref:Uncharacterized protein n=1 Tax=Phytophthora infestans TaxID=4787 RepID=A0A8S9V4H4_PHYIN|nr:hypothetical protein GN958_ATG03797 [Phytophthora infestans]
MKDIANERRQMIEWTRITTISVRLRAVGLQLPTKEYSLTCAANDGAVYLLNQPLQKTLFDLSAKQGRRYLNLSK